MVLKNTPERRWIPWIPRNTSLGKYQLLAETVNKIYELWNIFKEDD